jgi:hypothetical protein
MPELWTPVTEGHHEAFVERMNRSIAQFAERSGVEKPIVEVELADTSRFVLDHVEPEPGYGMVTVYVHSAHDDDAPDAIMIPIATIRRIELRTAPDERAARFGFVVADETQS